jgi:tetratricopeptide (TPR) repeat protein
MMCATVSAQPALAQGPSASTTLDAVERRAVVDQIARLLDEHYVFPDVGVRSGAHLRARLAAGAFDAMVDPQIYADALTSELQSVNHDKHMRVRLRPPRDASQAEADPGAAVSRQLREMQGRNFGFERVEHLEGNVGYLDLRYFAPPELARGMATATMQLLSNSDAIIIDLRRNDGGSPELVQLLCSYFFDTRTHLNSLYWRRGDRTQEFWTLDDLSGRRMPRVPLFVLTSSGTFSGAEEFSYNMQTRHRATLIGETTGGGANPGDEMPVNDRFAIFVPTGRAINPVTGTSWEGVGVKPDVAVDASAALDSALVRARAAARAYASAEIARETTARELLARRLAEARTLIGRQQLPAAEKMAGEALSTSLAENAVDERIINLLGYRELRAGEKVLAIAIFKANVAAFPTSANTHDSLGEAYTENGDRELATQSYRRSLEFDPGNANARAMLERLGSR